MVPAKKILMRKNSLHQIVQYIFLGFYIWVGIRFYQYVVWALGQTDTYVARPVAVEAFLPLGGLISFTRFISTGQFDLVHPAALVIFMLALTLALLLRKSFCSCLCPVGAGMNMAERIGARFGIVRTPPRWLSLLLYVPKYLLLAGFIYIVASMGIRDLNAFMATQYWRVSDTKMLLFFLQPSVLMIMVIAVILLGNMLIKGFWCQGLCPYGALLGLVSIFSPVAVRRDGQRCISCGRCARDCPSRIMVDRKKRVTSTACVGCGKCVTVCPADCLDFTVGYRKKNFTMQAWVIPVLTVALVLLFWVGAVNAGLWYTAVDKEQIREDHKAVHVLGHY